MMTLARRLILSAVVAAVVVIAVAPLAASASPTAITVIQVTSARLCGETTVVTFDTAVLRGQQWFPSMDDGRAAAEALIDGRWRSVRLVPGGEHVLRLLGVYPMVRIRAAGYRSTPAATQIGCL